jgi:enoyl-CoA hydratase/carnithine racemase
MASRSSPPTTSCASGILTGTGRAFCVGADLKEMARRNQVQVDVDARAAAGEIDDDERLAQLREEGLLGGARGDEPFSRCPKPVIAAVNGACVAGGMEMAIDCDIRIASTDAYFGLFEPKRGILAGYGVQHLARTIPFGEAMYLLLTSDRMSAEQALRWGFVHELLAPEELLTRAFEIAAMIVANAPLSVQGSKAAANVWRHYGMEESRRVFDAIAQVVFTSEDAREGPLAFAEKRDPRWKGR